MSKTTAPASYDPNRLFDLLLRRLNLEDDQVLSEHLNISRAFLFRIRRGERHLSAGLLIRISEHFGIALPELRKIIGDRRQEYRLEEPLKSSPASAPSSPHAMSWHRGHRDEVMVRDDPGLPNSVQWT